jgi:molybdopterin-guanine dinucleotide biosynthesis protein A
MIDERHITGLILAGGRGGRMGGLDKGLQTHAGQPLAMQALTRLSPQVGRVMISANRNLAAYEAMGVPVWPDAALDYAGPLAGVLVGLEHCETPYLISVPCDSPLFPLDLVARLAEALEREDAEIAIAATRDGEGAAPQLQPVFCLIKAGLRDSLSQFTRGGQRRIEQWTALHRRAVVLFDHAGDARAFTNVNTLGELRGLQAHD